MGSNLERKGRVDGLTQLLNFRNLAGIVRTTCNNTRIIHTINDNYFSRRRLMIGLYNEHGQFSDGRNWRLLS